LFEGKRVLIDANFRAEKQRRVFLDAAVACGVPLAFFVCRLQPETVRARLARRRDDVSDADWAVYQMAAEGWEEPSQATRPVIREIRTDGDETQSLTWAAEALRLQGLLDSQPGSGAK
jgi:predicted kinase